MKYRGEELIQPLEIGELQYVVTGTGRSGTVYMAKLLTSLGIPCGHEAVFRYDGWGKALDRINKKETVEISYIAKLASMADEQAGVNWFLQKKPLPLVADSSYMVAPFLDKEELKDIAIIHVVREPMKVINSFVVGFNYFKDKVGGEHKVYHDFIYEFVPEIRDVPDNVSRAALYYLRWNEMIEKKSVGHKYIRYCLGRSPGRLFSLIGVKTPVDYYKNQKVNHKSGQQDRYTSFQQIPIKSLASDINRMHNRYYSIKLA